MATYNGNIRACFSSLVSMPHPLCLLRAANIRLIHCFPFSTRIHFHEPHYYVHYAYVWFPDHVNNFNDPRACPTVKALLIKNGQNDCKRLCLLFIKQMYSAAWTIISVADEDHSFIDFFVSNITPCLAESSLLRASGNE